MGNKHHKRGRSVGLFKIMQEFQEFSDFWSWFLSKHEDGRYSVTYVNLLSHSSTKSFIFYAWRSRYSNFSVQKFYGDELFLKIVAQFVD